MSDTERFAGDSTDQLELNNLKNPRDPVME